MADKQKDMTALMDYAKAQQDAGKAPPIPEGSVMEEQKIEKVDNFESLEDYSKTHPAPEPSNEFGGAESPTESAAPAESPPPPPPESPPEQVPLESQGQAQPDANGLPNEGDFVTTPAESPTGLEGVPEAPPSEFPTTPPGGSENPSQMTEGMGTLPQPVLSNPDPTFAPGGDDLSALKLGAGTVGSEAPSQPPASESQFVASPEPESPAQIEVHAAEPSVSVAPPASEPSFSPQVHEGAQGQSFSSSVAPDELSPPVREQPSIREPLRPATKSPSAPKQAMEKVKQYSEQMSPGRDAVPASYPFSLLITGMLAPEERERLTDILSRENMGFRELDLEPQFEAGKILIPRISEYAGILLVSALRSTRAKMRLGPSDSIYASADTQDSTEEDLESSEHEVEAYSSESLHPAEDLPITTENTFPGNVRHAVVDIVTASAALKTLVVQAESSPEYQMLLEALQRELKYKAFRKGATAIVNFSVVLTQLHMPMHYRVMVTGSAIKIGHA